MLAALVSQIDDERNDIHLMIDSKSDANDFSFIAAYLVFLAAFSTFSYATNGIKAGAAASIFILALSYSDKLSICIPLLLVSLSFHHSMTLPLAAFALTFIFKNTKLIMAWMFGIMV